MPLKYLLSVFALIILAVPDLFSQTQPTMQSYPRVVSYLSFIIPAVTINKNVTTNDFSGGINKFAIGFPIGVNVLYSEHFGFSYEITPTVQASPGTSKTSKILFDPGPMYRFKHGFTIITRLAFDTEGRCGFTPVFNQMYARTKFVNYFVAVSVPARFGNNQLPSVGANLQLGFIFN